LERLKDYAVTVKVSHTEAARRFIELGLDRETTNGCAENNRPL
jgi:hypothetical protein